MHSKLAFITSAALTFSGLCAADYKIIIKNNCDNTIWPALAEHDWPQNVADPSLSSATRPDFTPACEPNKGAKVEPGCEWTATVPDKWIGGRVWARTGCNDDATVCQHAGCGKLQCSDYNFNEKMTVVEFGAGKAGVTGSQIDGIFYNISVMQGFDVPVSVVDNKDPATRKICSCADGAGPGGITGQAWVPADTYASPSVQFRAFADDNSFTITFCDGPVTCSSKRARHLHHHKRRIQA